MNRRHRKVLLVFAVLGLTAGGAALRLYDLGALGFFGDEETTALAARSLAEGRGSAMPSGMPYRRALPYTWLNAASARVVGLDSEPGYRIPAALIGAATIPLIYLAASSFAGPGAGLVAALLLATSGWHLVWSRTARMYVPALFAALAFFWVTWRWQLSGRHRELGGAIALYLLAVFLHSGSAAIVLFPVLFALLYDGERVSFRSATLAAGTMAIGGWLLDRVFVVAPYERWTAGFSASDSAPAGQLLGSLEKLALGLPPAVLVLLPVGVGIGWLWARSAGVFDEPRPRERSVVTALLAGGTVAAAFFGLPVAAASLGAATLLVDARGAAPWSRPVWAAVLVAGSALGTAGRVLADPTGPGAGLREVARTPFPYIPYLAQLLPVLVVLFLTFTAWLAVLRPARGREDRPVRAAALFVITYCLALGFAISWAPWRYLLIAYPWLLLVVAVGIREAVRHLSIRLPAVGEKVAWSAAAIALVAGAIDGHGISASRTVLSAEHGTFVPWNDPGLQIRPDHRSPGRFVRQHARPEDIIIAEDALEQKWYADRVDYWFRSESDAGRYLFRDDRGALRDIYVGAELMAHPPDPTLLDREDRAAWFITSGETAGARNWYLDPDQAGWLDSLESATEPIIRGQDGHSAVFCFGRCP